LCADHEVVLAARGSGDVRVDIASPASIRDRSGRWAAWTPWCRAREARRSRWQTRTSRSACRTS
jgi:hypothetical protein